MSNYFIAYLLVAAVLGIVAMLNRRAKEKRLIAYLERLEQTVNNNATVSNEYFALQRAIVCHGESLDPLYQSRLAYLKKRIEAHRNNPEHYPLAPAQWLAAFELTHAITDNNNGRN